MKILVKYHNPNLIKLDKLGIGDWIDLRAAEDVHLKEGEFRLISLGISVKLPKGESQRIDPQLQMRVVTVDREGRLYLGGGGTPVSLEELESELGRRRGEVPELKRSIHGDVDVNYGRVMDVVRIATKLGFEAPILSTSGKE